MFEVGRITGTSEYARNNSPEFGLRRQGAEFDSLMEHTGVREAEYATVSTSQNQPQGESAGDASLLGNGVEVLAYDAFGHIRRYGRFTGRELDVAI